MTSTLTTPDVGVITPECPHCHAPLWVNAETMLTCASETCCYAGESWTLDDVTRLTEKFAEEGSQWPIDAGRGRLL